MFISSISFRIPFYRAPVILACLFLISVEAANGQSDGSGSDDTPTYSVTAIGQSPAVANDSSFALPMEHEVKIGSVSHMISATLQTAGLYLQSDILARFRALFNKLAVLLFVMGSVGIVSTFVLRRDLRGLPILLLGSCLFLFATLTTTTVKPTYLRSGERIDPTAESNQLKMLTLIGSSEFYEKDPKVSFVFAAADRLISSVVQNTVRFFVDTKNSRDLIAVAREKALADVFTVKGVEPEYLQLLALGMARECGELTRGEGELSSLNTSIDLYTRRGDSRLPLLLQRKTALEQKIARLQVLKVPVPTQVGRYLAATYATGAIAAQPAFNSENPLSFPQNMSCNELWEHVWTITQVKAEHALADVELGDKDQTPIPWTVVKQEIEDTVGQGDPKKAVRIVAANILKNSLGDTSLQNIASNTFSQNPVEEHLYDLTYRRLSLTDGEGYLIVLQIFCAVVPYFQGLLLFVLAGLFPFFCLLLILPGRFHSFFTWFGLWVWVKSWDVGFALIHPFREFLWKIMNHRAGSTLQSENLDDISTVFSLMEELDPLVNLSVYHFIISILTLFVPVVTAHVCLGAEDLLAGFRDGLDRTAMRFQDRHAHSVRRIFASQIEQRMWEYEQSKGLEAAREFSSTAMGKHLAGKGDGAKARITDSVYQGAATHAHHEQEMNLRDLGMFARRGVSTSGMTSGNLSGSLIQARVNLENLKYQSPDAGEAHNRGVIANEETRKSPNSSSTGASSALPTETPDGGGT